MEEKIQAGMCANFREYDEITVSGDPNLSLGDGKCPAKGYIIHEDDICPKNCKSYEEYTIK